MLRLLPRPAWGAEVTAELTAAARADVDAMVVVPIDERTLGRAVELGTLYGLRTVDAVHLAALDRLPRPLGLKYIKILKHLAAGRPGPPVPCPGRRS